MDKRKCKIVNDVNFIFVIGLTVMHKRNCNHIGVSRVSY